MLPRKPARPSRGRRWIPPRTIMCAPPCRLWPASLTVLLAIFSIGTVPLDAASAQALVPAERTTKQAARSDTAGFTITDVMIPVDDGVELHGRLYRTELVGRATGEHVLVVIVLLKAIETVRSAQDHPRHIGAGEGRRYFKWLYLHQSYHTLDQRLRTETSPQSRAHWIRPRLDRRAETWPSA